MAIRLPGAALPQDLHDLLGLHCVGSDQNELAILREGRGIGLDHLVRQVPMCKMGFKDPDNGVLGRLRWHSSFRTPPSHRRSKARCKDRRTDVNCLFPYNSLIVNSVFKPRASQSFDRLVQVSRVVEYPNDGLFGQEAFREEPTDGGKFHVGAAILQNFLLPVQCSFSFPFLASAGGYSFKKTADGYDLKDVGVDNAGAIEGLKMIVDLINTGVLPKGSTQSVMEQKMSSGELATMVNGPWAWANLLESRGRFRSRAGAWGWWKSG